MNKRNLDARSALKFAIEMYIMENYVYRDREFNFEVLKDELIDCLSEVIDEEF